MPLSPLAEPSMADFRPVVLNCGGGSMTAFVTPTVIEPRADHVQDFEQYVLDAEDVVHSLNPRAPTQALCRRAWREPWWQDNWVPDNYPRCDVCEVVHVAVLQAIDGRWQMAAPGDAIRWRVVDRADPERAVHRLNGLHTDRALCGWTWVDVAAEGTAKEVSGKACELCALVAEVGVGHRVPGGKRMDRPAASQSQQGSVKPGKSQKKSKAVGTGARLRTGGPAAKWRAAQRADAASRRSHGSGSGSVRTVSGGLPTLGRGRR